MKILVFCSILLLHIVACQTITNTTVSWFFYKLKLCEYCYLIECFSLDLDQFLLVILLLELWQLQRRIYMQLPKIDIITSIHSMYTVIQMILCWLVFRYLVELTFDLEFTRNLSLSSTLIGNQFNLLFDRVFAPATARIRLDNDALVCLLKTLWICNGTGL